MSLRAGSSVGETDNGACDWNLVARAGRQKGIQCHAVYNVLWLPYHCPNVGVPVDVHVNAVPAGFRGLRSFGA